MTTTTEYALMAGASYISSRNAINRFPVPQGWTEQLELRTKIDSSGFEAAAFKKGNEIVISFAGTDPNDAGPFSNDMRTDLALINGMWSAQLLQAAEYYLQIKAANPGVVISLTGHSLGGGLAALIAVFFGVQATTFDQAPFAKSATSLSDNADTLKDLLATKLNTNGTHLYTNEMLAPLADYLLSRTPDSGIPRNSLVNTVQVEGEILDASLIGTLFSRIGNDAISLSNGKTTSGSNLHSQSLLTAFLQSAQTAASGKALNEVSKKLIGLLGLFFNTDLYAYSTGVSNTTNANFLDYLVRHEAGGIGGIAAGGDGMLTEFTADLNKLGTDIEGLNKQAQDALIAQGIEWYYWQSTDYARQEFFPTSGSLLQYTTAQGARLEGAQNKAMQYVKLWLDGYMGSVQGNTLLVRTPNYAAFDQWNVSAGTTGITATPLDASKSQIFIGNGGADIFTGGTKDDLLFGGVGDDVLDGGTGNDQLWGGAATDTYKFAGAFGKDLITDSDGQGLVKIDDQTVGQAKASGKRNVWTVKLDNGQFVGLAVYDNSSSFTGKNLVITRADSTDNTITVNNFNLAAAESSNGYLGIKLDPTQYVALLQGSGVNFWSNADANITSLDGEQSKVREKTGSSFSISLAVGAKSGDTITLGLTGQTGTCKAILGDETVDANGAMITLAEGQTEVSFAFIQDGGLDADAQGSLSVTYRGADGQSATSNSWGLNLQNREDPTHTITGDDPQSTTNKDNLFGSADADLIQGLTDDDALFGLDGDDKIEGGDGGDILQGGLGADILNGGAGDDVIYGSSTGAAPIGFAPTTDTIIAEGLNWIYTVDGVDDEGFRRGLIAGMPRDLQAGDLGNTIDAGAGDDVVIAGTGDDLVHGGEGKDDIRGLGGADVLLGDEGDDRIYGDGPAFDLARSGVGYALPEQHGADFIDGGEGNDILIGQGSDDIIYGGLGNDKIWGDDRDNDNTPLAVHGNDYLDGEDGNDIIVGGGRDDTLYGGAGDDELWGEGGSLTDVIGEFAGEDYLDGEEGDDKLFGGGRNDTLYGGAGNDVLYGDDPLRERTPEEFHGDDYLDGEDGDDKLVGGAKNDTLYGGAGNDVLWGDGGGHRLGESGYIDTSSHGDDYLDGGDGDDVLIGEGGKDTLFGGAGNDQLLGDDSSLDISLHGDDCLDGEDGDDLLDGQGGNDTLYGGTGNDQLQGGDGNDQLYGEDDDDLMWGDAGDDTLYGGAGNDQLQGGDGSDQLYGEDGNDRLFGQAGDDTIDGGDGDDAMIGGEGNDLLIGGAGNDTLIADAGDDTLVGGEGNNLYVIRAEAGHVTIEGSTGTSIVQLGAGINLSALSGGSSDSQATVLNFSGGPSISVQGDAAYQFGDGPLIDTQAIAVLIEEAQTPPPTPTPAPVPQPGTTITNLFDASGQMIGSSVKTIDAQGNTMTSIFSGSDGTGTKRSDSWTAVHGGHGTDTFNADGSNSGAVFNVDGTSTAYVDDGHGDRTQITSDAQGTKTGDSWTHADGTYGSDVFSSNGSSSGISYSATGSYSTYTDDGQGHRQVTNYDAHGQPIPTILGSSFADGSYRTTVNDGLGDIVSTLFSPNGVKRSDSWSKVDGMHGSDAFDIDGSSTGVAYNPDGSYATTDRDGQGQIITKYFTWQGNLTGSSITEMNGLNTITTFRDAAGVKLSESWTHADGTAGDDTVSPLDFNGLANLAAQSPARDMQDNLNWATDSGAGGDYWSRGIGQDYGADSWLPQSTGFRVRDAFYGFNRWDGELGDGWAQTWIGPLVVELYFATAAYASGYERPNEVVIGESRFVDERSGVDIDEQELFDGTKTLFSYSYVDGARMRTPTLVFSNPQVPVAMTFLGANGITDVFKDDGQGNAIVTSYDASGAKFGDVWVHDDGTNGVDFYGADGTSNGVTVTPGGVVTYAMDALGHATTIDYPGPYAVVTVTNNAPQTSGPASAPAPAPTDPLPAPAAAPPAPTVTPDGDGGTYTTGFLLGSAIVVHRNSHGITIGVDTDPGYAASAVQADNETVSWAYDADGKPASRSADDGHGGLVTYFYDAQGRVTKHSAAVTDSDGAVTTQKYDATGQLTGSIVRTAPSEGQTTTSNYDVAGRLTGTTIERSDGLGESITANYGSDAVLLNYVVRAVTGVNQITTTTYNAQGASIGTMVSSVSSDGVAETDNYDGSGNLIGSVVATTDSAGNINTANYEATGALASYVVLAMDEQNDAVITTYDAQGRKSHGDLLRPDGVQISTGYRQDGSSISTTTALDGSYSILARDSTGDTVSTEFNAQCVKLTDTWSRGNGSSGSDTFHADGTSSGTAAYRDGTTSSSITDANGGASTTHYAFGGTVTGSTVTTRTQLESRTVQYDVNGHPISDSWVGADGSSGSDSWNADGSISGTRINADGSSSSWTGDPHGANHAPEVAQPIGDQSAAQGGAWTFVVPAGTFNDVDAGDTLAYAATMADGDVLPAWVSFNSNTGRFSGTPLNGDVGSLSLKVTVADSAGATASSTFELTIANVNDSPVCGQAMPDQVATEDQAWSFTVPAGTFTDVDAGDALDYKSTLSDGSALPPWLSFDAATRTFIGKPLNADVGSIALKVTALDSSGASASSSFMLTVANVNDAPVAAGSLPGWDVVAGNAATYKVPATAFEDVDAGDLLSLTAGLADGAALPAWLKFDTGSGSLSGTPADADGGDFALNVTATDMGGLTAHQSISLHVESGRVLYGTDAIDTLTGGRANDFLDGRGGADTMRGGEGNDTYVVDSSGDVIIELPGEGTDTVDASITYALPAYVENLALTGDSLSVPATDLPPGVSLPILPDAASAPGINGTGNDLDNVLTGNARKNVLTGGAGADILDGRQGDDRLLGGTGNDGYFLGRGYGNDTIVEDDGTLGNKDVALFSAGIEADQLWFRKRGKDLEISIIGSDDAFEIQDWYKGDRYHVEQFKTSNGKTLLDSQVQNLVNAMASFSPPRAGENTLSPEYQSALGGVISASWQ